MRDTGIKENVGQRENSDSWDRAVSDGFVPGETLFSLEEAARQATIIQYLLSDAGQMAMWPRIKECLSDGNTLYFSHGFSIVYHEQTGVVAPSDVDVVLVAPKGSGRTVRSNFLDGSGINSSFAIHQDYTGTAREKTLALGIASGDRTPQQIDRPRKCPRGNPHSTASRFWNRRIQRRTAIANG